MKRAMLIVKVFCVAFAASLVAIAPAAADSISAVEGARATERSGRYLTDLDISALDRYGGNDDHPVDYEPAPYYYVPAPYAPYAPPYLYDEYYRD